ncbi:GNAT family N-acetyltransferase [Apibacter sp. HY039]|uniref:GNAT family N-acetyltransferase n=1 Tax=Apibacter sp. HY039 TaxID=2501476 RepID=UPI000FEB73B7|nr:GNAT family protein [Apibacter sp. HY039]
MNFELKKWEESDVMSLVKHANNYNIFRYLRDSFPFPYTEKDGQTFISLNLYENPVKEFAIHIDGKAVGAVGVTLQPDIYRKSVEIGYWLSESYWGKGIMPEVLKEMVNYSFSTWDISRVFAKPFSINEQSQKVLVKAGFEYEATLKKAIYKNDSYLDEMIFSVVR